MELLQDSEPEAVVAAPELPAARTAHLRLEHLRLGHLRVRQQQDEAHFRPHPRPEEVH